MQTRQKLVSLSPTFAYHLERCPYYTKVVRIDKEVSEKHGPDYHYGGAVHRALKEYFTNGGPDKISADDLVQRFQREWGGQKDTVADAFDSYMQKGVATLAQFPQHWHKEGAKFLGAEQQHKKDYKNQPVPFRLSGRMDVVYGWPNGVLEVVDFKTGRPKSNEELNGEISVPIYYALAKDKYGPLGYKDILISHFYLDDFQRVVANTKPEWLAPNRERLIGLAKILNEQRFEPKANYGCPNCVIKERCSVTMPQVFAGLPGMG